MTIEHLLATVKKNNPMADLGLLKRAYDFADAAHAGQKRMSGEPYINHPLGAAQILAEMRLDTTIIVAGLLHDVPEDTPVTLAEVKKNFGEDVASIVAGVTKLGKIKYRGVTRYLENLRKMFLAFAKDIRIILVKFADRLYNLRTLAALPEKKRYRIALESLEIYAPIAARLGMGEMRGQLEDASFKYTHPADYQWVERLEAETYRQKEEALEKIKKLTLQELATAGLKVQKIQTRVKHLYSLYKKLLLHEKDVSKVHDLMALRIIVDDIADCYAALGVVHKLWRPLKGRIKDYIAQPKPNGYQSLHTTVFCPVGKEILTVEFQIRTQKMHEDAEYGIAAHWHYAEQGAKIPSRYVAWVKELAGLQKEMLAELKLKDIETLKIDVFQNRIFVFTPKGDVLDLPENATPIDFAYTVHTEIGNKCIGARVNDQLVGLDTTLKNGDLVEIIIDKNRRGPSPDWLKFAHTHVARTQIKGHAKSSLSGWLKSKIKKPSA